MYHVITSFQAQRKIYAANTTVAADVLPEDTARALVLGGFLAVVGDAPAAEVAGEIVHDEVVIDADGHAMIEESLDGHVPIEESLDGHVPTEEALDGHVPTEEAADAETVAPASKSSRKRS